MQNYDKSHYVEEAPDKEKLATVLSHARIMCVVLKVTHACPAKRVVASSAYDLGAPSIFLDHHPAVRTRLCNHDLLEVVGKVLRCRRQDASQNGSQTCKTELLNLERISELSKALSTSQRFRAFNLIRHWINSDCAS